MSATITHKLNNAFQGALAGGGDPASSPLYVFGPFLRLIVVAGVAQVTFGVTVWLAVFTVLMVSAMYRQVMRWVSDGSGGSGLSEEEFGPWAVKINASISIIEYVLTFLVSMAALVTFAADRFPVLNAQFAGVSLRVAAAVGLTGLTCWLVNLGPRVATRAFGPATGAVLMLLWALIGATIYKLGFHLPDFNWQAFSLEQVSGATPKGVAQSSSYLNMTFAGYARILALMTGIEIFANLVAAYGGTRAEKSRKAFGSMVIIMGTTVLTMLIVGPAILHYADPLNDEVSVFTQTMDALLPPWASYAGTLIGIAVLLSAAASAAQAVQNLSLGLRYRHYISARMGQRNRHDVAGKPVWIMGGVMMACYVAFGTREETYLSLYAAGVFVLLSMTGWAAAKRLLREAHKMGGAVRFLGLAGTVIAALLTSVATLIIFKERFFEGAWAYFVMVPAFYAVLDHYRRKLGSPPVVEDRLGQILAGKAFVPQTFYHKRAEDSVIRRIVVPLDGKAESEQVMPLVRQLAQAYKASVDLVMVADDGTQVAREEQELYLSLLDEQLERDGIGAETALLHGPVARSIDAHAETIQADLIVLTTGVEGMRDRIFSDSVAERVIRKTLIPTLVVRPGESWRHRYTRFSHLLVALDGSSAAEAVVPYIRLFAKRFGGKVTLLTVPEGADSEAFGGTATQYLEGIAAPLRKLGFPVELLVRGSDPANSILDEAEGLKADLIMMASHGRGGLERHRMDLGSVPDKVLQRTACPVFVVPLTQSKD